MRLFFSTLLTAVLLPFLADAQILNPVKWSFSAEHAGGDEYDLIFNAQIDKDWTIYSQHLEDGGPVPTSFTFEDAAHYTRVGEVKESDNAKTVQDKVFEMTVVKFYGYAKFTQRVKVKDASKPVTGYLTFMTCDDEKCLAPKDVDFEFKLPKAAPGKSDAGEKKPESSSLASGSSVSNKELKPLEQETGSSGISKEPESQKTTAQTSNDQPEAIVPFDPADILNSGGDPDGILNPVTWSFRHEKVSDDTYKLIAQADLDEGWHIYTQDIDPDKIGPVPTTLFFEERPEVEFVGKVEEAGAKRVEGYDKFFDMNLVKYKGQATFTQEVKVTGQPLIHGELEFMACNEERCLNPQFVEFVYDLSKSPGTVSGPVEAIVDASMTGGTITDGYIDQTVPSIVTTYKEPLGDCADSGEETVEGKGLFWTFVLGFLGGLLALLTPCVFPMIPLTVSYFSKDTKRKGWVNGAWYGASIIVIYVAIGLLITAFFGATALNELSTNWIANTIFFLIFVLFAFSFFGYYEITLPSSWTNKSDRMADKGGFIGIFFMAFTLALVSFSCTGPIIGSALVESATNKLGPFVVMLGFSTALALPFGLFAAFPAWLNSLPRSGGWMNSVKVVLGFLELALAFKFLSVADMTSHWNFLRYEVFLGIWVLIAIAIAAYLFGFIKFPHDSKLKKVSFPRLSLAVLFTALGAYMFTGFFPNERTGTYNSLAMLSGLAPPAHYNYFKPVEGVDPDILSRYPSYSKCANNLDCFHDYYEGVAYAKEVGKPVFLDFTGYGCVNCRKTEEHIWVKDRVWKKLKEDFVMVSLYVDDRKPLDTILISKPRQEKLRNVGNKWADFQIVNFAQNTQPLYVIMTPEGEVLSNPRGYRESVDGYVDFLDCGLRAYESTSELLGEN